MITLDYDAMIPCGYYDEVFRTENGIQSKWHHLKFQEVRRALRKDWRIIDFGCGPGTFISTLAPDTIAYGVDASASQIAYAKERYETPGHQFFVAKDGRLPLANNSVDAVTSIEVIEHLLPHQQKAMLKEVLRVLVPGGTLLLTTPNYQSPWPILEFFINRLSRVSYQEQHVSKFSPRRLWRLAAEQGFDVQSVSGLLGLAPFAAALSWRLASSVHTIERRIAFLGLKFIITLVATKPMQVSDDR